jgi:hypothetical protein
MGERKSVYTVLVVKPEGKRPLGRPRHVWDAIKMNPPEEGWGAWAGSMWFMTGGGHL